MSEPCPKCGVGKRPQAVIIEVDDAHGDHDSTPDTRNRAERCAEFTKGLVEAIQRRFGAYPCEACLNSILSRVALPEWVLNSDDARFVLAQAERTGAADRYREWVVEHQ